ncbi:UNKNOWN [Stylonychia lemnae]|uniref:Uncharacterized protein n=1 Tax=Stylonychia lemnae TaxID=5949 RepID=A0A078B078_STYLE|nr:UNKNOWN [Stylonychia lemnae]|eukprot:CDW88070.1 UNKNOWN [Stylonychia lemnae]
MLSTIASNLYFTIELIHMYKEQNPADDIISQAEKDNMQKEYNYIFELLQCFHLLFKKYKGTHFNEKIQMLSILGFFSFSYLYRLIFNLYQASNYDQMQSFQKNQMTGYSIVIFFLLFFGEEFPLALIFVFQYLNNKNSNNRVNHQKQTVTKAIDSSEQLVNNLVVNEKEKYDQSDLTHSYIGQPQPTHLGMNTFRQNSENPNNENYISGRPNQRVTISKDSQSSRGDHKNFYYEQQSSADSLLIPHEFQKKHNQSY